MRFKDGLPVTTPVLDEFIGPASEVLEKLARKVGKSRSAFVTGNGIGSYREKVAATFKG